MVDIVLKPIAPEQVGDRPVINSGVSMVGMGGDNVFCGHCKREMMHGFPIGRMQVDMVYQCGGCEGYNEKPKK